MLKTSSPRSPDEKKECPGDHAHVYKKIVEEAEKTNPHGKEEPLLMHEIGI